MFNNLIVGQYYPANSLLHRLDPRTKIVLTLAFIMVLFVANSPAAYAGLLAYSLLAAGLSGLPIRLLLRGLKPVMYLIVLTFLLQVFMTPGDAIWRIGPLVATRQGLREGGLVGGRLVLLMLTTSLLTLTTSPIMLTDGLERLLLPFSRVGLPAHELAMMMTIALRFIPTLMDEAEKIMKAQMARGADFEHGGLMKRAKNLIPLLVPLFISAFRRADELALAMEARCYRGGKNRTHLRELRFNKLDLAAGFVSSALFLWVVVWRF